MKLGIKQLRSLIHEETKKVRRKLNEESDPTSAGIHDIVAAVASGVAEYVHRADFDELIEASYAAFEDEHESGNIIDLPEGSDEDIALITQQVLMNSKAASALKKMVSTVVRDVVDDVIRDYQ